MNPHCNDCIELRTQCERCTDHQNDYDEDWVEYYEDNG